MRPRQMLALVSGLALAIPAGALLATPVEAATAAAAAVAPAPDRMPGDVPSKKTPWVLDGEVSKIVQVGNVMIAGGVFTQVADPMNGTPYTRQNLVAFDATTGLVSQTFNPTVEGPVQQLLPGPIPNTVYVAGDFTKINNKGPNHIQLLNLTTGQAVTSFKAPSTNGGIQTIEMLPNNRLFIGGFFTKIAGVNHGQLVTLNATTGALDPFMDITGGEPAQHRRRRPGAHRPPGVRRHPRGDRYHRHRQRLSSCRCGEEYACHWTRTRRCEPAMTGARSAAPDQASGERFTDASPAAKALVLAAVGSCRRARRAARSRQLDC